MFSAQGFYLPGVDLITACDIRYCAQDAFFQVKVSHPPNFCFFEPCLMLGKEGRAETVQAVQVGGRREGLEQAQTASWKR